MKRSLALFGVLGLLCAVLTGCSYHDYDHGHYDRGHYGHGHYGHGRRWHSDSPRYHYGGYDGHHHHRHYRHGYDHGRHRDYCD